jgi:diguanylate cyclase (GGDEF)-like protein
MSLEKQSPIVETMGKEKRNGGAGENISPQSEETQRQILALSGRDLQLWSITLLVSLALFAGFAALVAPNLVWKGGVFRAEGRYLPQLFFGLISLVVLFNVYIIAQKRELNNTRKALVEELIFNERLEGLSLIDPLTQLYNRRAVDQMLPTEVFRANRLGSPLTLFMVDIDNFKSINARFGHRLGDQLLTKTGQLLRSTFRGSDTVFRYGADEFLVVMPETNEVQAEYAVKRLSRQLDCWNIENQVVCELSLSWGLASYVSGARLADVLQAAHRKMFLQKRSLVPVF